MLQKWVLGKQAGFYWLKGMEEHSLEVKVHAEYNNSLCSIVDRNVYCKKSGIIQTFGTLALYKYIRPELVSSEMIINALENMKLARS